MKSVTTPKERIEGRRNTTQKGRGGSQQHPQGERRKHSTTQKETIVAHRSGSLGALLLPLSLLGVVSYHHPQGGGGGKTAPQRGEEGRWYHPKGLRLFLSWARVVAAPPSVFGVVLLSPLLSGGASFPSSPVMYSSRIQRNVYVSWFV